MKLNSMTGFAQSSGETPSGEIWAWEIRSVNAKGLDVRLRLPPSCEALEGPVRKAAAEALKRGNVSANLTLRQGAGSGGYQINEPFLETLVARASKGASEAPRLDVLLTAKGVIEQAEPDTDDQQSRDEVLLTGFVQALNDLARMRAAEGQALAPTLAGHLDTLEQLTEQARELAASQPEAIRARLQGQVKDLIADAAGMPEERLAQEVALLAAKADIREELDRLRAHIDQARELMASGEPCGRRLDFLSQELNREANTLCSKSQDLELTRIGLDLKATIEQWREQIQNIE